MQTVVQETLVNNQQKNKNPWISHETIQLIEERQEILQTGTA